MTSSNSQDELLKILAKEAYDKENLPHLYVDLYPWQKEFIESRNKLNFITAGNQTGKLLRNSELIPTPNGFKKNGDLKVGDKVIGRDGKETEVIAVYPHKEWQLYKITFDDGSFAYSGLEHLWWAKTPSNRFKREWKCNRGKKKGQILENKNFDKFEVLSTEQIIKLGTYSPEAKPGRRVSIPVCDPVEYPSRNLFDPYLIGLLIGDGGLTTSQVRLTSIDQEIIDYVTKKYNCGKYFNKSFGIKGLRPKMDEILGRKLSIHKNIPEEYLLGSISERKELLAGLMDTDGYCDKRGEVSYSTSSEELRDNFIELINSLGGIVNRVYTKHPFYRKDGIKIEGKPNYNIAFRVLFNPFKLTRKKDRFKLVVAHRHERIIVKVEKAHIEDATCIKVNNEDSSYLCTKNYIVTHNSVSLILKNIILATEPDRWKEWWPEVITEGRKITQFWYFYPDADSVTREVKEKWVKEWLPRGKYKDFGKYAWKLNTSHGQVDSIEFINSGVTIYFFTYTQDPSVLQASTVFMMTADEELPYKLFGELNARLTNTDGYFNMGFTATLGQDEWRRTMEEIGTENELFPHAYKKCISLYDCQIKTSGKKTKWSDEKIQERINSYATHKEVLVRVFGRFVSLEGLKFPQFDIKRHFVKGHFIPKNWLRYAAIDPGAGGTAHPCGIVFIAVKPDFTEGRVYKCWRGDNVETSSSDILEKFLDLSKGESLTTAFYDYESKDLYLVATRMGIALTPANKKKDIGEGIVNSLFKNDMLKIYYYPDDEENHKLKNELMHLRNEQKKSSKSVKDNLADPLRYAAVGIPWNFKDVIQRSPVGEETQVYDKREDIRIKQLKGDKSYLEEEIKADEALDNEISYWNNLINEDF